MGEISSEFMGDLVCYVWPQLVETKGNCYRMMDSGTF